MAAFGSPPVPDTNSIQAYGGNLAMGGKLIDPTKLPSMAGNTIAARHYIASVVQPALNGTSTGPFNPWVKLPTLPKLKPSKTAAPRQILGSGTVDPGFLKKTTPDNNTTPQGQIDYSSLFGNSGDEAKLAEWMAQQAVNSNVGAYRLEQSQLLNQGQRNAMNIIAAANAASQLNSGLPNTLNKAYSDAANQLAAIAKGFGGQLQTTDQNQASGLANPVTSSGLNLQTSPAGAYNAMFASHGAIPASSLAQSGLNAMQTAQALPNLIQGAGHQGSLLAEGAAQQKANSLFGNIAQAQAKLPQLAQSYLNALSSQDLKKAGIQIALSKLQGTPLDWAKLKLQGQHYSTLSQEAVARILNERRSLNLKTGSALAGDYSKAGKLASELLTGKIIQKAGAGVAGITQPGESPVSVVNQIAAQFPRLPIQDIRSIVFGASAGGQLTQNGQITQNPFYLPGG